MDNYRQPRRPVQRQTIDGFVHRTGRTRDGEQLQPISETVTPVAPTPVEPPHIPAQLGSTALSIGRSLPPISLDLDTVPAAKHKPIGHHPWRTFRKWSFRAVAALLILTIGLGGLLFSQGYLKLHKVFKGTATSAAALQKNVDPTLLKGEGDGRVNILLLGIGGGTHDAPDLTDTIMIASIDPVNNTAVLLSVPRDLWVTIPQHGSMKINAAYETGKYRYLGHIDNSNANYQAVQAGFSMIDQTIESVVGVPIHYNMLVNFQAFKQGVDSVNGITVNVPEELYDPTMAWENNWNPVLAKVGVQQMNGTQALLYVRSRETSSDFARGQRQRTVIVALKDKILTLGTLSNPLKISQLMGAFGNNVVTDISLSDAVRMYNLTKDIDNAQIQSVDLVTPPNSLVTTGNMNGISIDEPRAGLGVYNAIQAFTRITLKDGYITKENAQITVLNGTTLPGVGTEKANELKSYGYNVTKVDNAPTSTYDKTVIVDLTNGVDKYTRHYLENRYGVKAVTTIPDKTIVPGSANFIIILGNDQT